MRFPSPSRAGGVWRLPGAALREALREGYTRGDLRADLAAGLVVGIVALPLSMALAIASGVPPQHGLYTAIVGGAAIAVCGGSRVQVSGPTAAFVVILAPISARFGVGGLALATLMAGGLLAMLGAARMGRLIQFIPSPVTSGFTAGIAIVIATLQLRDLLGLTVERMPERFLERVAAIVAALPTARASDVAVGALTLAILLWWPRVTRRLPAPLLALAVGALAGWALTAFWPGVRLETIGSRFSAVVDGTVVRGIPGLPPLPRWPWELPGADGAPIGLSLDLLRALVGPAFAIAILGAIESLLSAVVADGMTGRQHDPDAELVGQGLGNLLLPFFGGIAATGAIARTATNVRYGGRSPLAAVWHSAFVLVAMLALAPLLAWLPMASLAALLLIVAWNMSEARHVLHLARTAPRGDTLVLLSCLGLTVVFDMVIAVTAGVVFASLLFMKRMAEVSSSGLITEDHPSFDAEFPREVVVYEVAGPLFFGAAQKAMSTLRTIRKNVRVVVFDMRAVPLVDATGLVNLASAIARLESAEILVVLCGVRPQPGHVLARAGWRDRPGRFVVCPTFERAVEVVRGHLAARGR